MSVGIKFRPVCLGCVACRRKSLFFSKALSHPAKLVVPKPRLSFQIDSGKKKDNAAYLLNFQAEAAESEKEKNKMQRQCAIRRTTPISIKQTTLIALIKWSAKKKKQLLKRRPEDDVMCPAVLRDQAKCIVGSENVDGYEIRPFTQPVVVGFPGLGLQCWQVPLFCVVRF